VFSISRGPKSDGLGVSGGFFINVIDLLESIREGGLTKLTSLLVVMPMTAVGSIVADAAIITFPLMFGPEANELATAGDARCMVYPLR